jgi:hypothetical protein
MKIKLLLLTFFTLSASLFSQVNEKLDLKNGFRQFKLGSSPTQIKNIILKENYLEITENPDLKIYDYLGGDMKTIADVPITSISLYFYKGKLESINADFGSNYEDFEEKQFKDILYNLEDIYGEWKYPTDINNNITNGAIFKGKKVTFEFFRMEYPKGSKKYRGYIHVYDNYLQKQLIESEL